MSCFLLECVAVSIWLHREWEQPFPSSALAGPNLWGQEANYHLLGCLEPCLSLERTVLMLVLRRKETHTDNYFLSSMPLCEHMCQTYLNFDHETHAELDVKRSIGWGGPRAPLLGDYNECGCPPSAESPWETGGLWQRPPHGALSLLLSRSDSPERRGCHAWKPPTLPWLLSSHQAISCSKAERKWFEKSNLCSLSPGRMWGGMSDKREDAEHLLGQPKSLSHLTWKLTPVLCSVPTGPHSLSHFVLTTSWEAGFYF